MMRFARTLLLLSLAGAPLARVQAQQTNEQLAARCAELGAIFDRYGTRRSEGSGGPDMIRLGAGIDCQKAATPRASRRWKISCSATRSPIRRADLQRSTTPIASISTSRPFTASALTATRVEVTTDALSAVPNALLTAAMSRMSVT